jgi:hypothetical protein
VKEIKRETGLLIISSVLCQAGIVDIEDPRAKIFLHLRQSHEMDLRQLPVGAVTCCLVKNAAVPSDASHVMSDNLSEAILNPLHVLHLILVDDEEFVEVGEPPDDAVYIFKVILAELIFAGVLIEENGLPDIVNGKRLDRATMISLKLLVGRTPEVPSNVVVGEEERVGGIVEGNVVTNSWLEDQSIGFRGFCSRLGIDSEGSWEGRGVGALRVPDFN